jgi:hypothetical protein
MVRQPFELRRNLPTTMDDQLLEADGLALDILKRLEAGEPLSAVALSALRLADSQGDVVHRTWIAAEITGIEESRQPREWTKEQLEGLEMFFHTRSARLVASLKEATDHVKQGKMLPKGDRGLFASLHALEDLRGPDPPATGSNLDLYMQAMSVVSESQRILVLVRKDLHTWVSVSRAQIHSLRVRTEMLGPDAPTVFAAGGKLLHELSKAVDSLRRPAMQATAAMQARTALLTLGRELHSGGPEHVSPITGKKHLIIGEKNKLLAFLDDLWSRAPTDRRPLIEKALAAVDEAYDLGSKAKNPLAITYAEAEAAVKDVYAVAHAICFAGGFSPSQS